MSGQFDLPGILLWALAVPEPIAHHELNPGCCQHIDRCRGLELFACHQFEAHNAWVRREYGGRWFCGRVIVGECVTAARARHAPGRGFSLFIGAPRAARRKICLLHCLYEGWIVKLSGVWGLM